MIAVISTHKDNGNIILRVVIHQHCMKCLQISSLISNMATNMHSLISTALRQTNASILPTINDYEWLTHTTTILGSALYSYYYYTHKGPTKCVDNLYSDKAAIHLFTHRHLCTAVYGSVKTHVGWLLPNNTLSAAYSTKWP